MVRKCLDAWKAPLKSPLDFAVENCAMMIARFGVKPQLLGQSGRHFVFKIFNGLRHLLLPLFRQWPLLAQS
jgi:hypothetical protein